MIFAVFDPSPLTVCINCSFLHSYMIWVLVSGSDIVINSSKNVMVMCVAPPTYGTIVVVVFKLYSFRCSYVKINVSWYLCWRVKTVIYLFAEYFHIYFQSFLQLVRQKERRWTASCSLHSVSVQPTMCRNAELKNLTLSHVTSLCCVHIECCTRVVVVVRRDDVQWT